MRKTIILLLCAVLIVGSAFASGAEEKKASKDAPMDIAFRWFDYVDLEGDPLAEYVNQKFNINFYCEPLAWDERASQQTLAYATGDLPDVMTYEGFTKKDLVQFAQSGVIRPFPSLEPYPNMVKTFESLGAMAKYDFMIDGQLYAWPKSGNSNPYGNWGEWAFIYRSDWAKQLGMYKEEYTFDEMLELCEAFVKMDPGKTGGKTLGLVDAYGFSSPTFVTAYLDGSKLIAGSNWRLNDKGEYECILRDPQIKEGLKAFKAHYDKGGIDADFYLRKGEDGWIQFANGFSGVCYTGPTINGLLQYKKQFEEGTGLVFEDCVDIMKVTFPDGKRRNSEATSYWTAYTLPSNISDEKVAKILELTDWMLSKEGTYTMFYGIPEKDWTMKDGQVVCLWEKDADGNFIDPDYAMRLYMWMAQMLSVYYPLNPMVPEKIKEMADTSYKQYTENTNVLPMDLKRSTFQGQNYLDNNVLMNNEFAEFILGEMPTKDIDTILSDYDAFLAKWSDRIDAMQTELNSK